jgi:hypothetical protein
VRRNSSAGGGPRRGRSPVVVAFDELRFRRENTLDLRSSLPTGAEAAARAEAFLRERQMASAAEVLVITGRGNQSVDGIAVVRPAVTGALARLRRGGVVAGWREHTPGSLVVTPAPISALFEAPRRHGDSAEVAVVDHKAFAGLGDPTRHALRQLAIRSLQTLGARTDESLVQDEMQRQYTVLCQSIRPGPDREAHLRVAAERAAGELDDAE